MTRPTMFGASVRGPSHVSLGEPNQDSWAARMAHGHGVAVVADGLGSRRNSDQGSKAACAAAIEALRLWLPNDAAGPQALAALIQVVWRVRIGALVPNEAASTCLFACIGPSRRLVGALGDGLVLWRSRDGIGVMKPDPERTDPGSTEALGVSRGLAAWRFAELPVDTEAIVLCTDGVAEDLLPERYGLFLDWLKADIGACPPPTRRRRLHRALTNWPTPRHLDDKTVAYMEAP